VKIEGTVPNFEKGTIVNHTTNMCDLCDVNLDTNIGLKAKKMKVKMKWEVLCLFLPMGNIGGKYSVSYRPSGEGHPTGLGMLRATTGLGMINVAGLGML
jgi:hypothetical protein